MFVAASVPAQLFQDLLLPTARHIEGMVVDAKGQPIAGVQLDHQNDRLQAQTDSNGRFTLDTRAPVVLLRKAGFRSELVRTQDSAEVRITLQKVTGIRTFPTCSGTGLFGGIHGWGGSFQFRRVWGVRASGQVSDADYGARYYYVDTKQGRKGIRHGSGPLWSFGTPSDLDVWRSDRYEEAAFDVGGLRIIDARGRLRNGNRWRYLGKFGESASYSDIDEATAKILDKFLDGACLKSRPRR
jgi:hypothetical protein